MNEKCDLTTIEEVNDPLLISNAKRRREAFDRNFSWFRAHASEIYDAHRGKCICVSCQNVFAADTPESALALAEAAHPEDPGRFVQYIPAEKMARIYANHW